MIELLVVLGIGMILIAMAVPLVSTTLNMYRLRGGGSDYANLAQTARMRAVTDDRYYEIVNNIGAAPAAGVNAYVNTGTTATGGPVAGPGYTLGDPAVAFSTKIVIRAQAAGPGLLNLYNQFLPGIAPGAVAINPNAWDPNAVTFGPRGLPCQATAATGGTCTYTSNPGALPIAYEVFVQNVVSGVWEAVTVNPSGRVRQWQYDAAAARWRPLD